MAVRTHVAIFLAPLLINAFGAYLSIFGINRLFRVPLIIRKKCFHQIYLPYLIEHFNDKLALAV